MNDNRNKKQPTPSLPQRPLLHPEVGWREPGGRMHAEPPQEDATERCVVSKGHSISMPTARQIIVGYDATEKREVYSLAQDLLGPGSVVMLGPREAARMRRLGFVVNETGVAFAGNGSAA